MVGEHHACSEAHQAFSGDVRRRSDRDWGSRVAGSNPAVPTIFRTALEPFWDQGRRSGRAGASQGRRSWQLSCLRRSAQHRAARPDPAACSSRDNPLDRAAARLGTRVPAVPGTFARLFGRRNLPVDHLPSRCMTIREGTRITCDLQYAATGTGVTRPAFAEARPAAPL
jgi:hypothetical protein